MATNERVQIDSGDVSAGQLATSQIARTNFTPGKATSLPGDMNWPKDHRIPTGTPAFDGEAAGPVEMQRTRVVKLGRNIVSDQVVNAPVASAPETTTITDTAHWGATTPISVLTPTSAQKVDGVQERKAGSDSIVGA
jgi:hypothetical protein